MKNNFKKYIQLLFLILFVSGCSAFMMGYTKDKALDRFLLVDQQKDTFGYNRMKYQIGYNSALDGFVKQHGMPNFIYEYENNEGRESIRLYYVDKNQVYVYESNSWTANSLYLKELRELTEYEKLSYQELLKSENSAN